MFNSRVNVFEKVVVTVKVADELEGQEGLL